MVAAGAAAAVTLAACGGTDAGRGGPPAEAAVVIQNFRFSPTPLTIKVGSTLTVTNRDGTDHTFTADDHSFDTGRFSSGSKALVLSTAGRFTYHCEVHNFMTGEVDVTP